MAGPLSTSLSASLSALRDLALDLRWTWSHEADALWPRIDRDRWEQARNPWTLLQAVPAATLDNLANDARFVADLADLAARRQAYLEGPTWFDTAYGADRPGEIAFFCLEFGLGEALPLYAGGLGVLAGDYLKTASDLGVPAVGVGLLYQEGYFRQTLDAQGGQRESFPFNDPATMPIEPAMVGGGWLRVSVELPGRELQLRVWRARVGRVSLYLLDSNDPQNSPADRGLTGTLYGDGPETRIMQELALGVGGWRALEALGHDPEICHINEGHAAFAVIERARSLAVRDGIGFEQAFWASRAGNVFTSHTPVAAGFDRFEPGLARRYLSPLAAALSAVGGGLEALFDLGASAEGGAAFNMAHLAMRGSGASFAVSALHQTVSQSLFQPLFARWPPGEAPISHVTNGVHTPSWDSAEADALWTEVCGKDRWRAPDGGLSDRIAGVADEVIWTMRGAARQTLVGQVRARLARQLQARGLSPDAVAAARQVLDPNILTLGLARRFTDYKRPNLLLRDKARFARILLDPARPAQIVLAGKAHPADFAGKAMIREWIDFANDPQLAARVVFLEDYDLALAQELVQGVDVWINTPRRPWEACGTSGMKVLVNGGLNASVLDGWWAEAFQPDLGWRIGDGRDNRDGALDADDALALYAVLEQQISPEFHDRDETGAPRAWIARVRRSMSRLAPNFSGARMVRDYVERAYRPAAARLRERLADQGAAAGQLADWAARLERGWPALHIDAPSVTAADDRLRVSVAVFLGDIGPDEVAVELYADGRGGGPPERIPLRLGQAISGASGGWIFTGEIETGRPADEFTARVIPRHPGAAVPTELALIAWQR